jgi:DOPA 4,5-dioxygenase
MERIEDFHAHVYFDATTLERARSLCEAARDRFGLAMGQMHRQAVGPHPRWSCQLTVPNERFGEVLAWLALHRDGLTLFIHPNTGDDLADHRDHAIWMGELLPLNLEMFQKS